MATSSPTRAPTIDAEEYFLSGLSSLPSPCLVVYRSKVEQNIERMRGYLEDIAPGSSFEHLRTHVKTHKSAWATQLLLNAGVRRYKCSLQELDMLLDSGAQDIFLAYPLLPRDAGFLAQRIAQYPTVHLIGQIGCLAHAEYMAAAARRYSVEIPVVIDVDVGQHRTGTQVENVKALARAVTTDPRLETLKIVGIHGYDGHNHYKDVGERKACARVTMQKVVDCVRTLESLGITSETITVGGTPPFVEDLEVLLQEHQLDGHVDVSPGTWIYWDTNYDGIRPCQFDFAALVYAQVMDHPVDDIVTLNLGNKRWSVDCGPAHIFSTPGLEVVFANEEHTKLRRSSETPELKIGDPVLLVPRHVCTTVNLWEHFAIVGPDGTIETTAETVTARNR